MNAHTAAVLDFQAPLKFKQKGIKPIKIHFADGLSSSQKQAISYLFTKTWKDWRIYSMRAKDINNGNADIDYEMAQRLSYYAMGQLCSLLMLDVISQQENNRLNALFTEQADLFDDLQAA